MKKQNEQHIKGKIYRSCEKSIVSPAQERPEKNVLILFLIPGANGIFAALSVKNDPVAQLNRATAF